MGVKRLTSFIQSPDVLQWMNLNTIDRVIIDGAGLKHYLYNLLIDECQCGQICGGEYAAFEAKILEFFDMLKRCEVEAFLVFDGADDLDGKKLAELHKRCELKIEKANNVANNRLDMKINLMPPLAHELLLQTLRDLSVPFAFTNFEADNEIAGLANKWRCPIMAGDSDFYIFNVDAGYIPFWYLNWEQQSVQIYTLSRFCSKFNISKDQMPLFATLAGNDYVISSSLHEFFDRIRLNTSNPHGRLRHIMKWLSNQRSVQSSLQDIHRFISNKARSDINTSLRMYELSCESQLAEYFTHQFSSCEGFMDTKVTQATWCVDLIRNGTFPPYLINVMTSYRMPTLIQVENHDLPSSNCISKRLRQILYGILLLDDDAHPVEEHERVGNKLNVVQVKPEYLEEVPHVPLRRMLVQNASKTERENTILAALKVKFDREVLYNNDIPPCFHLPVCAIIHWLSWKEEPKVCISALDALLLCWINGVAKKFLLMKSKHPQKQHSRNKQILDPAFDKLLRWTPQEVYSLIEFFEHEVLIHGWKR